MHAVQVFHVKKMKETVRKGKNQAINLRIWKRSPKIPSPKERRRYGSFLLLLKCLWTGLLVKWQDKKRHDRKKVAKSKKLKSDSEVSDKSSSGTDSDDDDAPRSIITGTSVVIGERSLHLHASTQANESRWAEIGPHKINCWKLSELPNGTIWTANFNVILEQ